MRFFTFTEFVQVNLGIRKIVPEKFKIFVGKICLQLVDVLLLYFMYFKGIFHVYQGMHGVFSIHWFI